ncbi:MAG: hypothetical protein IJ849_00680 [Selenomonadaceae bacterium]|nr:hypothetical protein [Selenomonadaceae bacterium]
MKIISRSLKVLTGIVTGFLCFNAAPGVEAAAAENFSAPTLRRSVSHFNWSYYDILPKDKNLFYSPYSIDTALSLLANGAAGQTKQELCQALGVNALNALNEDQLAFQRHLQKDYGEDITLATANMLLVNKDQARKGIGRDFKKTAQKYYGAETRVADFARRLDKEKENIQKWVDKNTNHFMPDYRSIATKNTVADLLNVIYFQGVWEMPFQEEWTKSDFFTCVSGQKSRVDMMRRTFEREVAYYADDKYQGVVLPYGFKRPKKNAVPSLAAMYLILPKQEKNLTLGTDWSKEPLNYRQEFLQNMRKAPKYRGEVDVMLPKLNLDLDNAIADNLKAMGIEQAFERSAQFPHIIPQEKIAIDNVEHRAKLKIDEQGTEAAAITEISMVGTTAAPTEAAPYIPFFCNRPFLLVICDAATEVELFTGLINEQ